MKTRTIVLLVALAALASCSHKKKGMLFFLPDSGSSSPALNNTIETPVDTAPANTTPTTDGNTTPTPSTGTGNSGTTPATGADNSGTTPSSGGTDSATTPSTTVVDNSGNTTPSTGGSNGGTTPPSTGGDNTGTTPTTGENSGTGNTGTEPKPEVVVAHISESEFRSEGIPVTDCIKGLAIPSPDQKSVKYDDFHNNLCQIDGIWYIVIPWNFRDGNFKMKIEKKIPKAKYLLSAMMGTYDLDGYRDRMYPQRFATPPYKPVYNVNYTNQNWLVTDQDVFLIDVQKHAWINFDRNYALFRIFVEDREVTNLYGLKSHDEGREDKDQKDGAKDSDRHNDSDDHKDADDHRDADHHDGKGDDLDLSQYKDGTTIRLTVSNQSYVIAPPPSTITAYLLQTYGARTSVQTISLGILAIGLVGLIVVLARQKRSV